MSCSSPGTTVKSSWIGWCRRASLGRRAFHRRLLRRRTLSSARSAVVGPRLSGGLPVPGSHAPRAPRAGVRMPLAPPWSRQTWPRCPRSLRHRLRRAPRCRCRRRPPPWPPLWRPRRWPIRPPSPPPPPPPPPPTPTPPPTVRTPTHRKFVGASRRTRRRPTAQRCAACAAVAFVFCGEATTDRSLTLTLILTVTLALTLTLTLALTLALTRTLALTLALTLIRRHRPLSGRARCGGRRRTARHATAGRRGGGAAPLNPKNPNQTPAPALTPNPERCPT